MALGIDVRTHDSRNGRLPSVLERIQDLRPSIPGSRDRVLSEAFVRRHTRFESVSAFCDASPSQRATIGSVQRLDADERDAFVDRTTDFETWAALTDHAALEDALTHYTG